ncbi:MAG TPA: beta-aspartyl-peptidase [Bacteroidetes bacterium]|nr:beta-aspartyl-peptidase [Bacteroidota bacterium]HAE35107.1 beta-aspartyl-peptidase [Bacteroidota bacterium]HQU38855.1 isoaspartyl peptidase/L-asparaginase [Chitinophagales bacterium]HQU75714.1 isoaspartyl peptidase/L-asparaginase [Chitinophagales bacterium]
MKSILAIHGGAGTITRSSMSEEMEAAYLQGLRDALEAGRIAYLRGDAAEDICAAAVVSLEENPLYNAGKGAVFTHAGDHEMDAAMMRGSDLAAGAVAGVRFVRNPVLLARAVMKYEEHVLLSGTGADAFARLQGLETVSNNWFDTPHRRLQYEQALAEDIIILDHHEKKFGTVGAVALDQKNNIAAATSTGGMTNKKFGRIGDSPLIGSGTYANNETCAVSCTGHGEYFIRYAVAYDLSCRIAYGKQTLNDAADELIYKVLQDAGGEGGLIAINRLGEVTLPFNSPGMYRGILHENGDVEVAIYRS